MAQYGVIDNLASRFPEPVKWGLCGLGGAVGFVYAERQGSTVPTSCVVAGAVIGFCFVVLLIGVLRFAKLVVIIGGVLVIFNFAVLVPFGYGDQLPVWLAMARAIASFVMRQLVGLADRWISGLR